MCVRRCACKLLPRGKTRLQKSHLIWHGEVEPSRMSEVIASSRGLPRENLEDGEGDGLNEGEAPFIVASAGLQKTIRYSWHYHYTQIEWLLKNSLESIGRLQTSNTNRWGKGNNPCAVYRLTHPHWNINFWLQQIRIKITTGMGQDQHIGSTGQRSKRRESVVI